MNAAVRERLYELMPAIYRIRDLDDGQTLRAFMAVLEREYRALETDIAGLYDDWFVETCHERIVPYIADLVGVSGLLDAQHVQGTRRRYVANVTTYRRNVGTLQTVSNIARDVTGWPVQVQDLSMLVAHTQHVQNPHAERSQTFDVRKPISHEAFDTTSYVPDVRHIAPAVGDGIFRTGSVQGRYNLADLGVFLWRLQTYPVIASIPARVGPGRYTFDPTGLDTQLFQPARTAGAPRERDLPLALTRAPTSHPQAFEVWLENASDPVSADEITVADLSRWDRREATPITVDPVLGRIACVPEQRLASVSYWYAFSADVGCGPFDRQMSVDVALASRSVTWRAQVGQTGTFRTLAEAVEAWNARPAGEAGVIAIVDNGTYEAPTGPLVVRDGSFLAVVGGRTNASNELVASMARPCVRGDLSVTGRDAGEQPGELLMDGVYWDGALDVQGGDLGHLALRHMTFVPADGGLSVSAGNPRLTLSVETSICGPVEVHDGNCDVHVAHSILDASGERALDARDAVVHIRASTLFGSSRAGVLEARDSLFVGRVEVERRQAGGIEASFVSPASRTGPRERCQPDLALAEAPAEQREWIRSRLVPSFMSTHFGDPGYAQLTPGTPSELRAGGTNDGEMGAFHSLYQPLRMTSFLNVLREFLPADRDVGVFFAS